MGFQATATKKTNQIKLAESISGSVDHTKNREALFDIYDSADLTDSDDLQSVDNEILEGNIKTEVAHRYKHAQDALLKCVNQVCTFLYNNLHLA